MLLMTGAISDTHNVTLTISEVGSAVEFSINISVLYLPIVWSSGIE